MWLHFPPPIVYFKCHYLELSTDLAAAFRFLFGFVMLVNGSISRQKALIGNNGHIEKIWVSFHPIISEDQFVRAENVTDHSEVFHLAVIKVISW